uniref:Retrovirus-related Pol polyprotein from transposon TNT 1-94 n=1 Tax=Tanacetum cinerariifolium TaxID=118510 RepID=A0A6L2KZX2_TANCI|nr:retrovirus-related Pol polyprotein from transposon TNT 1-94 [Tanacetum cinerariifolium]
MAKVPYASAVGSVMYAMATLYFSRKKVFLEGFFDLDYRGCLDSKKSNTGYVFTVGGTLISWMSRIQKCVAMSTIEAEYMAIAEIGKELVWLKNFLKELERAQTECVLFSNNQNAIHLAKNLVFHGRTKHIKIRYHYIRELVSEWTLYLKKILEAKNPADMLTKREVIPNLIMLVRIPCIESLLALQLVNATCSYVRRFRKVRAIALLKGRWLKVYRDYLRRRAVK